MQVQTVKLDQDFGTSFSGVLVSADDKLRALWASYSEQVGLSRALPALFQPYHGVGEPNVCSQAAQLLRRSGQDAS